MKTTRFILLPIALICFSCAPDFDFDAISLGSGMSYGYNSVPPPPGGPATFTITIEGDTTFVITGDALALGYGSHGPGSVIHQRYVNWMDTTKYYELKCAGPYGSELFLTSSLYTTYTGKPINPLKTGMFNGRDASFTYGKILYQAYHFQDPIINQSTGTTVYIDKISGRRIDGHFNGKYYQPDTQQIVSIKGEFTKVYIDFDVW